MYMYNPQMQKIRQAFDAAHIQDVRGEVISRMRAAGLAGVPGMDDPYERLKELTRGRRVSLAQIHSFVQTLGLPPDAEARLTALTPATYTALASELVERFVDPAP